MTSMSAAQTISPRSSSEDSRRTSCDVPSKLSLDRILRNKPCMFKIICIGYRSLTSRIGSPMSLYDFYMYLKYIEHSAENLEFYVW